MFRTDLLNIDGAGLLTGHAGCAGPELIFADGFFHDGFGLPLVRRSGEQFRALLATGGPSDSGSSALVKGVFPSKVGWADVLATAAIGAGLKI